MTRGSAFGRSRSQRRAAPLKSSSRSPIQAIVDQIPGFAGRVDAIDPLEGGITNRNYRVLVAGETFVVRGGGERTELPGIDRAPEAEAPPPRGRAGKGWGASPALPCWCPAS